FGDGFDVVPDRDDSRYGWSMSQQGFVSRYDWKTGNNYTVRPTHPDPDMKLRFNWNAAINIDPFDNNTLYFGSQFVHKSTDKGETWSIISGDLSTNDPEKQKQSDSGGLTMDATGAENHCTILVVEPSPLEQDMLWVGTDDGRVHYTQNGGSTWTDVTSNIKGLPAGSWIPQIKASNKNKGEALLIANDYRRFNYTPYAYRTKDYGKTWKRIVDGNDVESYTLSIVEDILEPNLLFLGTDDGLYVSFNAGDSWTKWTEGFPTVSVKDLVIHPREHDLVIGTFGRAVWVLDDIRPLREIAGNNAVINDKLKLFKPPTAVQASYQQPTGTRFGGDALYSGDNRGFGAQMQYFVQIDKKKPAANLKDDEEEKAEDAANSEKEDKKVKWDSLIMKIYEGDRLIRTLKRKAPKESGIYKWSWAMNEKGPDRASRVIRKQRREPGGVRVKPGKYKVVLHYGDQSSEQQIEVIGDPRLKVSSAVINDIYSTSKDIENMRQLVADAVKQLLESKAIANEYRANLSKLDKEKYKDQIKASKEIVKSIDAIIDDYLGKVDKRQGITRSPDPTVNQRLGVAARYVATRQNGITETERRLISQAREALNEALSETNVFFNDAWMKYRSDMEGLEISPFKETRIFSND
ncbi:MAG: hypothetical protein HKO90_03540, partial [Flavobacteriaceae bacterium]|nr:hypothetical protein [Flavobacteriaceae bacterium]